MPAGALNPVSDGAIMPTQRPGIWTRAKHIAVAAPFVLYTAVMSADSASAADVKTGPAVFPATTPFYVTRPETLEIHGATRATFDSVIDGDVGHGTVYWTPGTHHVGAGTSISFDKGTPIPTMPGNTSDIIDILGIIVAIVLFALVIARHDIRVAQLNDLACRVVENAARLLPPQRTRDLSRGMDSLAAGPTNQRCPTAPTPCRSPQHRLSGSPTTSPNTQVVPTRTGGPMTRPLLFVSTAASILTTAVVTSWITAAILLTAILIATTALCWILADHDRPRRLALLLTDWRHGIPPTPDQPTTLPTKPQIIINYREEDSEQTSSILHSALSRALGYGNVIVASTSTQQGTNRHRAIENQLRRADTMLVLIGPHWMNIHDEHGTRLLDHDNDHLRSEIEQALALNLRVIPILLDNATLDTARLPPQIADLGNHHQLHYRHDHHDHDLRTIIEDLAFASHNERTDPS